jgi:hypothetical protein
MQILNTTTTEIETLIYAPTGCDCLPDLIADDTTVTWGETKDGETIRTASADSISFWRDWIAAAGKADELEAELADKLGDKMAACEVSIEAASGVEFNDQPAARIAAIQEALWIAPENDARYSINSESNGNPSPQWVLRWCDDYIAGFNTIAGAIAASRDHKAARNSTLTRRFDA